MFNVKLVYQSYGAGFALGIEGDSKEIGYFANYLFNYGVTNSAPNFVSDRFAYVLIFESLAFKKFMVQNTLTRMVAAMARDHFLPMVEGHVISPYALGSKE